MKQAPGWHVLNRGIAGERSDQILARFPALLETLKPDLVIVLAGVNDLYQGRPAGAVKANLTRIYDLAARRRIRTAACSILPYNTASSEILARMDDVNRWIEKECRSRGMIYCDTYRLMDNPERPGTLQGSPDGAHPSPGGYRKMGEYLAETLKKYITD